VAADKSALDTVVEADEVRLRLLEEEKRLLARGAAKDQAEGTHDADAHDDSDGDRLRQVYEKLEEIKAGSAVGRYAAGLYSLSVCLPLCECVCV
jgi:hypothetical protein